MSTGAHEPEGTDALHELQRAAQRREELADAYQQKARKYREEARELRRLVTRLTRSTAGGSEGPGCFRRPGAAPGGAGAGP